MQLKENYDYVIIGSGFGGSVSALRLAEKGYSVLVIEKEEYQPSIIKRTLVIAPPKTGEKLDLIVEKLVELGVDEIVFIKTRYAYRDIINLERITKISISYINQSK